MKYFRKLIGFLKSPEKSFESVKEETLGQTFRYVIFLILISAVISSVYYYLSLPWIIGETAPPTAILVFLGLTIMTYISMTIVLTIYGLWLHLLAYVFGARGGIKQTIKSVYYGITPYYILSWIPVISSIFLLWFLALEFIGLEKLQEMTGWKAFLVVLISLIPIIIATGFLTSYMIQSIKSSAFMKAMTS